MDASVRHRAQDGQATAEYIGIVVVVALLLVGASVVVRHFTGPRLDPRPTPVIPAAVERVTEPLDRLSGSSGNRPGRWTRFVRAVRKGGRLVGVGGAAFGRGFGHAVMRDLEALVRDPVAFLRAGSDLTSALRDPVGTVRSLSRDLRAYVRELRVMDGEAAYRRIMEDLGGLSEDVVVSRGRMFVLKRLRRAALDRARRFDGGAVESPTRP